MNPLSKFSNLRVWQKLTLVAVALTMPILMLAYLTIAGGRGEQSSVTAFVVILLGAAWPAG